MFVRWGCSISKGFNVTNGVHQGGVLSPKLFNVYIDWLINILNNCTTGGFLCDKRINHMLYADDLCIESLPSAGLQNLLSICDKIPGVNHTVYYYIVIISNINTVFYLVSGLSILTHSYIGHNYNCRKWSEAIISLMVLGIGE